MKAVTYHGAGKIRVDNVPEPEILTPHDAIVKISTTAICGSDLHMFNGYVPTVEKGDIFGHEFMGEIVAVGSELRNVKTGDRVLVPFTISCGHCTHCRKGETSMCDNSNPNAALGDMAVGYTPSGLYGYSHAFGGYPGGQAEYVRVIFADVNCFKVPDKFTDEQVLFLTDILPTGWQAAENANVKAGDVIAVWGCGPVGLFAIQSAFLQGAERVIAIDRIPDRLERARALGADTMNIDDDDIVNLLKTETAGRGPDAVIDCVGMEAHAHTVDAVLDKAKQSVKLTTDRAHVLRQAIFCCSKGGTVSVPGVYVGAVDLFPMGMVVQKGLTIKSGQTNVHRYLQPLLDRIDKGEIHPETVITHRLPLADAVHAYDIFIKKEDHCEKVVLKP